MEYHFQVNLGEQGFQYEIAYLTGKLWKKDCRSGFLMEAEARQAGLLRLLDLTEASGMVDQSLSFLDMATIMLGDLRVSASALKTYQSRLGAYARLHQRPIGKITTEDLRSLLGHYQTTHSSASTQAVTAFGRRVFVCAQKQFQVTRFNPFDEIGSLKPLPEYVQKAPGLPMETAEKILQDLEGEVQLLFALLAFCGLRLAEAQALHRADIDFRSDRIIIRRATDPAGAEIPLASPGPSRILPLPPTVRQLVLIRPLAFNRRLFQKSHKPAAIQKTLRRHGVTLADLRRSYLKALLDHGTEPAAAAWLLGVTLDGLSSLEE